MTSTIDNGRAIPSARSVGAGLGLSNGDDPLLPNLQVVVFLVDSCRPSTSAGGYVQLHSGQSLLPMFCHSVARLYEYARFTILTTATTKLPALPFPTEVFARSLAEGPLLYGRMRHYIAFLEQAPVDRTYLFLESDMLMLERLRLDIAEDWDVAIAYKSRDIWINSGMLLVRAHRSEAALAFLRQAVTLYEERYLNDPRWGADQAALRDAIGLKEVPTGPRVEVTGTARVLLLPRDEFTRFASWYARPSPPATWILHFSGSRRKTAMPHFYRVHIGNGSHLGAIRHDFRVGLRLSWRSAVATWKRRAILVSETLRGRPVPEWPNLLLALFASKLAARREQGADRKSSHGQ